MIGLFFVLKTALFLALFVIVVFLFVLIPLFIYGIPYCLWVGSQNTVGKQKHLKKDEGFWKTTKNATKLYICWINRVGGS